ncbi:RDD family protein [Kitasatospora sp. NPDC058046]|uniref:RDD family protein n=1 Tax=Kitasatospora sp. NPDC058046 TaxID=3346312 RepID=UPI0036DF6D8E
MTDRPFAAAGDPAVAPEPGYYPDPSIPGFIRYWGGSAWVPGTSRPAPAEGEVPAPPRYATRPPVPGGPAARAVPPPMVLLEAVAPEAGCAGPAAPEPVAPEQVALGAVPLGSVPPGSAPSGVAPPGSVAEVRGGLPAGGGDTGPVYFDQTSGGASFVLGPRVAEVIGGPVFRTVDGPGVLSGVSPGVPFGVPSGAPSGGPSGFAGAEPPGVVDAPVAFGAVPEAVPVPVPGLGLGPAPAPAAAPVAGDFESGWQADPRAQRGLMETGDAPRWVSWGVLPEAPEVEQGRAEPERAPIAAELAAAGAPAVAVAVREAPVPAVLASGPVPVVGEEMLRSPLRAPAPVPTAAASKPLAAAAATASAHAAPLPAVRAVRETAVQPRPSAATPVPAPSRAARTSRDARTTRIPGPAGLGRRLAARTVDTAVLLVVAVAAGIPLGNSVSDHLRQKVDQARMASALTRRQVQVWLVDDVVLGKIAVLIGILLFVSLLYEVLPVARTGQTFGKRIVRIRVVDAAAPAARTRLSLGRSLLRWAVRQLGAVLLLGLVWPVFDRTARRGWQDRAARTRVVRG